MTTLLEAMKKAGLITEGQIKEEQRRKEAKQRAQEKLKEMEKQDKPTEENTDEASTLNNAGRGAAAPQGGRRVGTQPKEAGARNRR